MSTAADGPPRPTGEPAKSPQFELDFLVNDEVDPTELTVFATDEGDITTHWITVDFDAAIPIEAVQ